VFEQGLQAAVTALEVADSDGHEDYANMVGADST
jgi:hypothetical protein